MIIFVEFHRVSKNKFELAMVNEPSVFKLLRFDCIHQPHYNMAGYNMVLDITRFKDGSQKCLDYIEKWSFFNIIYTFLFGYNTVV